MNFAKLLRTPFLQNTSERLLLEQSLLESSMFFVRVDSNCENFHRFSVAQTGFRDLKVLIQNSEQNSLSCVV